MEIKEKLLDTIQVLKEQTWCGFMKSSSHIHKRTDTHTSDYISHSQKLAKYLNIL